MANVSSNPLFLLCMEPGLDGTGNAGGCIRWVGGLPRSPKGAPAQQPPALTTCEVRSAKKGEKQETQIMKRRRVALVLKRVE